MVECKLLHKGLEATIAEGLAQTVDYMVRCDAEAGHLVVFDRSTSRGWDEKVFRREESHGGRNVPSGGCRLASSSLSAGAPTLWSRRVRALVGSLLCALVVAVGVLVAATPAAVAQRPESAPDAYLDETARRLVLGARAARDTARITIDSYTALVRERLGVSLSHARRNRQLANGESAMRIRWSAGEPEIVDVLGSRLHFRSFHLGGSFGQVAVRKAADPLQDPFTPDPAKPE